MVQAGQNMMSHIGVQATVSSSSAARARAVSPAAWPTSVHRPVVKVRARTSIGWRSREGQSAMGIAGARMGGVQGGHNMMAQLCVQASL